MSKPKTITMSAHLAELHQLEMNHVRIDIRRVALDHAVSTQREGDTAETVVKRAKAFEAYLAGKKAQ